MKDVFEEQTKVSLHINKFEQLSEESTSWKKVESTQNQLWYYKDGLRSPMSPKKDKIQANCTEPNDFTKVLNLEEILDICAQYEKEIEEEVNSGFSPPTTSQTQNRIKTNGSFSRDKKLIHSPTAASLDSQEFFNIEVSSNHISHQKSNEKLFPSSPRTKIKTVIEGISALEERENERKNKEDEENEEQKKNYSSSKMSTSTSFLSKAPLVSSSTGHLMPSSRLIIGTSMLAHRQTQESIKKMESLSHDSESQMVINSSLKQQLESLELLESEELQELELEESFLLAELNSEKKSIYRLGLELEEYKRQELRVSTEFKNWNFSALAKMNESQRNIERLSQELEKSFRNGKGNAAFVKTTAEALEAEKKAFEDMEFNQMEAEAAFESQKEEISVNQREIQRTLESHENKLIRLESQIWDLMKSGREETRVLERKRKALKMMIQEEKQKLEGLESQVRTFRFKNLYEETQTLGEESQFLTGEEPGFPGEETQFPGEDDDDEEEEEEDENFFTNVELEKSLKRLALYSTGKSKENDDEEMSSCRNNEQIRSLNSVGSENSGSLSDIPSESLSSDKSTDKKRKQRRYKMLGLPNSSEEDSLSHWNNSRTEVKRRISKKTPPQQRPLTRYLPIRNEDFDLRLHIETAGHQIDLLDSYLILNSFSCRGYLIKLGTKFRKRNRRWFVFDRRKRTLIYYSDKSESKAKGGVTFTAIEEVYVDHSTTTSVKSPKETFCVKTNERKYYLLAPNSEVMRIWVDVIFTGAEGYQGYFTTPLNN